MLKNAGIYFQISRLSSRLRWIINGGVMAASDHVVKRPLTRKVVEDGREGWGKTVEEIVVEWWKKLW